ncbi:BTAD domain-containing putative transcriptional regulator [Catellatospora chokoriensis]|uniref:SARP family transcriptional regulator n=1 Tax=Catellatospora chokoriensis TaxID=310353 RepID=A0A8J3KBM9_9ACTN|nr:BTAD domain-containing putative transcriptional regulator [Catellatospora chokoriensis]GIF93768.1 SARP family transcriptional regulator [Catellatospora chokoriensis]
MQDGPSAVGRYIRERRRRAGLSQSELAIRAGTGLAGLRDLEQGRVRRPRPGTLRRLAAALDLSAAQIATLVGLAHDDTDATGLRIHVLGPLLVTAAPSAVDLGSPKRRELLGLLALSPNLAVSADELVDLLWGTPNGAQLLTTHVSRLRARLGPSSARIVAAGGGYRLDATADQLDLLDFRRSLSRARELVTDGRPEAAVPHYRAAVALWRGEPLADLPGLHSHPALIALARDRRACVIEYADAGAPHDDALAALHPLAEADPFDEALWQRLITALAGTGQRAAALAAFHTLRRRLREELGVDPAPELQRVYRDLLSETAGSRPPVPQQLPPARHGFTGRAADLAALDRLLADWAGATPLICAISGMAGVGKSTLAVHWAHTVQSSFPDGQLYVDLRGFDPGRPAATADEVVRLFLEALQPGGQLPSTAHAQVARYRSLLAGRRMLIVLDNARDAEQVRPVLPGAPGCTVLVTSRDRLTGLVATEGAHPLDLAVFDADDARSFLSARLGARRVAGEEHATAEIVERCGRLPLALAVVAARAAAHPGFALAALAAELHGAHGTLSALEVGDPTADVRSVFAHSYRDLGPDSARMFRRLALHPGPEISVAAAAALAATPPAPARRQLRELAGAHLLEEPAPGRFRLHDLLREYAHELVRADEGDDGCAAAAGRLSGHYLHTAAGAALLLAPRRDPITLAAGTAGETLAGHREALAWFGVEYPVLLAMVDIADDPYLWQLGWALTTYQDRTGRWQDWVDVQDKALRAAQRAQDPVGLAHSQRGYGRALTWLGHGDAARLALCRAVELFTELGELAALGHLELDLAQVDEQSGHPDRAMDHAERGAAYYERAGHQAGLANALNMICVQLAAMERFEQGVTYGQRALALLRQLGDRRGEAATLDSLGVIQLRLGEHARASASLAAAHRLFEEIGDRPGCADVLLHAGDCHHAAGSAHEAVAAWQAALAILEELGLQDADKARRRLGLLVA